MAIGKIKVLGYFVPFYSGEDEEVVLSVLLFNWI